MFFIEIFSSTDLCKAWVTASNMTIATHLYKHGNFCMKMQKKILTIYFNKKLDKNHASVLTLILQITRNHIYVFNDYVSLYLLPQIILVCKS